MSIENLITDHLETWTAAHVPKKSGGRGRGRKTNGQSAYGIKKLREFILELAVRGKLVPQDPDDESATSLLKRISGKSDESHHKAPTFILQAGWASALIPQVVAKNRYAIKRGPFGSSIKKDFFVPTGYKVYEQQHAIYDDFSLGNYYINYEKFKELKAFEVLPNDVIISCSGTVGRIAIAPAQMEPGIINQALLKLTLNQNALSNDYFKILFPAFYMKTDTLSDLKGTAQKNMVSVHTLKKEPFPLPPLTEQHRIVAKVDELMTLCDKLEKEQTDNSETHQLLVKTLLSTLTHSRDHQDFIETWQQIEQNFDILFTTEASIDELKQTILQLAVMGKLVPQDPTDEPADSLVEKIIKVQSWLMKAEGLRTKAKAEIDSAEEYITRPHGWKYSRLGNIAKFIDYRGRTPKKIEAGIPLITAKNIRFGYISREPHEYISEAEYDEWMTRGFPKIGDILFTTEAPLGNVALLDIEEKFALAQRAICFQLHVPEIAAFLKVLIMSNIFQNQLIENATGMTATGIKSSKLKEIPIPLPPLSEQDRIVAKVDELMAICDSLKERLNDAQTTQVQLADAIVGQAVSTNG